MEITSPLVSVSYIVEIPIVKELSELTTKILDRPVFIGIMILIGFLGYFAFKK